MLSSLLTSFSLCQNELKQTLPSSEYCTYFRVPARVVILPRRLAALLENEKTGHAILFSLSSVCHTMRCLGVILLQFSFWRLLCVRVNTITGKPQEGCACVCICACGCILGLELQINSLFLSRDQEGTRRKPESERPKKDCGLLREEIKGARAFLEGGGSQRALRSQTAAS